MPFLGALRVQNVKISILFGQNCLIWLIFLWKIRLFLKKNDEICVTKTIAI